jgi:peroxiredoxin Q/BCP
VLKESGAITATVGSPLPDIALPSTRGRPMSPAEFRGDKAVVLYFYPGNGNPHPELAGCTEEARALHAILDPIKSMRGQVLGVSRQRPDEQLAFSEALSLGFPLLSDLEGKLGGALGVPAISAGRATYWKRVTFLADRHGILRRIFREVDVAHHAAQVLEALLDVSRR